MTNAIHRKSIATVALSGTLADKLEAAADAGFDGVEVMEADLLGFDGSPVDVRRMAEDLGLSIDLYQPFRDFEAMPDHQAARNLDRAERKFDIMQALGAPMILVCSNTQATALDDDSRAAAHLHAMAERAAARQLLVGFEALSWGRHIRRWAHAWRIVQAAAHPALGLIVDSFHTLALNDDPAGIAQVPADRLFYVQLADAPRRDMDVLSWSRHYRNFPGQGDLPVQAFLRAVLASGYQGPLSLEVFNDQFRAAPSRTIARDGLRALIAIEDEAGPAALPPPPVIGGVAFLEFAVDAQAGDALAARLAQLGFHLAGRHRSKDVSLWRQGRLRLVLNAEQDSAAAEHFQHHGPSVCAMALHVDDPARVLARARALLVQTWHEPTGPGERRIPAVRGPDGTLIYLVTDEPDPGFWNDDFALLPPPEAPAGAGLVGVDHVAIALAPWQMDSFVLFWRTLFGLVPQPVLDVPDPYGLVQSRAMANGTGTLRLTFNVSEARDSATSRFIDVFSGPGVHHIALEAADAEAATAFAAAHGAALLAIPPNYYEDLAARIDLSEADLATLERHGLLFDQDPAGTFRHAYTAPFQQRFFFELVERRGYTGFGAANAPIRMSAQARGRAITP